jgi:CHAD domain-containing protein
LLAECCHKPSRGRIHELRVRTLRLQAGLAHWRREQDRNSPPAQLVEQWNKEGKKLRRSLSTVREADVHLEKLAKLSRSAAGKAAREASRGSRFHREFTDLERIITRQRRTARKRFIVRLENDQARLERLCDEMKAAFARRGPSPWGCSAASIITLIGDLAQTTLPEISDRTLHEYRKRIKTVRYLAEISPGPDARCRELVAALKKMQVALGEWHDWQALAETASRKYSSELKELLRNLEKKSLQKALRLCRRSMTQLLNMRPASEASLNEKCFSPQRSLPAGLVVSSIRAAS